MQSLPQEIADMIFKLLAIPDQICFSLTCKFLFACLQSYIIEQNMP